ncbi:hypothetical protein GF337_05310 [candidate division KSB1 bacterium]|nr:hypothetical protein [candidate division KSB1 bacterium]
MSYNYKNDDFLLQIDDESEKTLSIVYKYDAFLDALTTTNFEHLREATRRAIHFFVSDKYQNTEQVARYTYQRSYKLRTRYTSEKDYLGHIRIKDKKSFSIDLATGTGKSWVIYAVAQIMLAEGLVDKVLVLCPSLTIEEELKKKFEEFSGDQSHIQILKELNALSFSPAIKSANDPILNNDICVENIHAAYKRTGSSIKDSFLKKGQRTLVISDEAHHIYSASESEFSSKEWFKFLTNEEYGFYYLLGLTGTPYIGDEYFHDVIYRYSLKQAMEDGIIKKIDYKVEEESHKDKGFDETYANHADMQTKYAGVLKPITIIVTDKIVRCIQVWNELVKYISEKEDLTYEQAAKKVIWVTSGIPGKKNEKAVIESILTNAEKTRKENLAALKTVDDPENPVEWIVSVSMLTEGWDVKNVFQIVPHEQRAFNSKLLISQVLGRGLRIPPGLEQPVLVKINNHEKWTDNIRNLYNEVLEIENRISWGYDDDRKQYVFPLYNLEYTTVRDVVETKGEPASEPEQIRFNPQSKQREETSTYTISGEFRFTIETKNIVTIDHAAREIKLFLKDKNKKLSKKWSIERIKNFLIENLERDGYDFSFLTKENLAFAKQAFGPMFRELGKEAPREKMQPDSLKEIKMSEMQKQSFSENALKDSGKVFYTSSSVNTLECEQKELFAGFLEDKNKLHKMGDEFLLRYGNVEHELKFLKDNLIEIEEEKFLCPFNMVFVSHNPEYLFVKSIFNHKELFESFIKSPDKGFYSFPYSYKPDEKGSTHVKRENFNPDFFLKLNDKNEILVVEIKKEGDTSQKNKAKFRDGKAHFEYLNQKLKEKNIDWKYCFYFLSPEDRTDFFQALRENRYKNWKSSLMQSLVQ